jgi:uncharacterized protein (DUF433 family)
MDMQAVPRPISQEDLARSIAQCTQNLPAALDDDGVLRVGGTRVRLETIINAFHLGCTAEEILLKYPSLELRDIYAVIASYLGRSDEVRIYLESRRSQIEEADRELEARLPSAGIRERLLARQQTPS